MMLLLAPGMGIGSAAALPSYIGRQRRVQTLEGAGQQRAGARGYLAACLFEQVNTTVERLAGRLPAFEASKVPPLNKPYYSASKSSPFKMSDKCVNHAYHLAYGRYLYPMAMDFVSNAQRETKVLEIGLGCSQSNVGSGVRLWNALFANSEGRKVTLHVVEYDLTCARYWERRWAHEFQHVNLTIYTGDQADPLFLKNVSDSGGGAYDAIIDDGGHKIHQQQISLLHLFPLLKPGGWYAVEDIQTSFIPRFVQGSQHKHEKRPTTTQLFGMMVSWLSGNPDETSFLHKHFSDIMPLVEHVDCFTEICVLERYL